MEFMSEHLPTLAQILPTVRFPPKIHVYYVNIFVVFSPTAFLRGLEGNVGVYGSKGWKAECVGAGAKLFV